MSLEIIIGPMFSGKSTEIIRLYDLYKQKMKVLIINYSGDNRYTNEEYICTHNQIKRKAIKLYNLEELEKEYYDYEYFLIDESHFFNDLNKFTHKILKLNKKITIIGLNGDINGKPFNNIISLIPFCSKIKYLTSICSYCNDKGILHIKKTKEKLTNNIEEYKKIGGNEEYKTVCKKHFFEYQ